MNPENSQIPPQTSEIPVGDPVVQNITNEQPAKKSPAQMIMGLFESIKEKIKKPKAETAPTAAPMEASSESPVIDSPQKPIISKKLILITVVIVVILIILGLVMSMVNKNGGVILPTPTPSVTPTSTPTAEVPSQYADDEDVAQIKSQMEELNKTLNESSFRDETLRIPTLDWNVSFEE